MPLILVWPDAGDADAAIRALPADLINDAVVVAWDPGADDGGRAALLTSVRDARDVLAGRGADPDQLTLVGFGMGAVAAAGLARYAKRLGIGLGRVIAVAGAWDEPDPFSGIPFEDLPERVELIPDSYPPGARSSVLARMLRATKG